jgi:hypothetical protein
MQEIRLYDIADNHEMGLAYGRGNVGVFFGENSLPDVAKYLACTLCTIMQKTSLNDHFPVRFSQILTNKIFA